MVKGEDEVVEQLLDAAKFGLEKQVELQALVPTIRDDTIWCEICLAPLCEPVTLLSGNTFCKFCLNDHTETSLGFGTSINLQFWNLLKRTQPKQLQATRLLSRAIQDIMGNKIDSALELIDNAVILYPQFAKAVAYRASLLQERRSDPKEILKEAEKAQVLLLSRKIYLSEMSPSVMVPSTRRLWLRLFFTKSKTLYGLRRLEDALLFASLACVLDDSDEYNGNLRQIINELFKLKSQDLQQDINRILEKLASPEGFLRLESGDVAQIAAPLEIGFDETILTEIEAELECTLCMNLLYEPTALACGHSMCLTCLARTLDHAFLAEPKCPLCRLRLGSFLEHLNREALQNAKRTGSNFAHGAKQICITHHFEVLIKKIFPGKYIGRKHQVAREESANGGEGQSEYKIPIFFCTLAFPGLPCTLHIFEPRYRLMMRRCIESGQRKFGMVLHPQQKAGTLLRIEKFTQLEDGRSLVETTGECRFEVLGDYGENDGYAIATVQWLLDEDSDNDKDEIERLSRKLRELSEKRAQERGMTYFSFTYENYGPIPSDQYKMFFWALACNVVNRPVPISRQYELLYGENTKNSHLSRLKCYLALESTVNNGIEKATNQGDQAKT